MVTVFRETITLFTSFPFVVISTIKLSALYSFAQRSEPDFKYLANGISATGNVSKMHASNQSFWRLYTSVLGIHELLPQL